MNSICKIAVVTALLFTAGCGTSIVSHQPKLDIEQTLSAAMDHADQDEYGEAICLMDQLDAQNPNQVIVLLIRGVLLRRAGGYDKAIADLSTVIKLDPNNAEALTHRAFAYQQQEGENWTERAIDDAKAAIKIDDNSISRLVRGTALLSQGKSKESIEQFDRAIQLNPMSFSSYGNRAMAFAELGQLSQAQRDIKCALSIEMPESDRMGMEERARHIEMLRAVQGRDKKSRSTVLRSQ